MSSTADNLVTSTIERWVRKVEFLTTANLSDLGDKSHGLTMYNLDELDEAADRTLLAKRSKPSYQWESDEHDRWWHVWFQESNLTIQLDLHLPNGEHQMNMYEIDLEQCQTATDFIDWLYHSLIHKQWACPELLWAAMEVAEEASQKRFGESLSSAYKTKERLNW
jgi:hypothetical protein